MEISSELTAIFRDVFEDETLQLNSDTSAEDVEGWDSVAHISLIFAIEEEFGFQFTSKELAGMRSVGDLQAIIDRRAR